MKLTKNEKAVIRVILVDNLALFRSILSRMITFQVDGKKPKTLPNERKVLMTNIKTIETLIERFDTEPEDDEAELYTE